MNHKLEETRNVLFPEVKWTLWDKFTMPFCRARNCIRGIWRGFLNRCQRFKIGYSDVDVWNMDSWFISTAQPMLERLLKEHHGHPGNIKNEEWESILQEMIDCLNLMDEDNVQEYLGIASNDYSVESYKNVIDLMDAKKNRFFELFSKWFFALWD